MHCQIDSYLGKLYVPYYEEKSFYVKVFEYSQFESNSNLIFNNIHTYEVVGQSDVLNFKMSNVFSLQTKLKIIIFVVWYKSQKISIYTIPYLSENSNLMELINFKSDFDIAFPWDMNFVVTDGPTTLAIHKDQIVIMSLMFDISKNFNLYPHIEDFSELQLLNYNTYEIYDEDIILYVLILKTLKSSIKSIRIFIICQTLNSGQFYNQMYEVPVGTFFPVYYETLLSAIYLTFSHENCSFKRNDDGSVNDIDSFFSKNECILCTNQQFLIFQNRLLKYCCNINLNDVNRIILIPQIYSSEEKAFLLQSSERGILLIKYNKSSDIYECIETWSDASFVCVDDFLKNCGRQILLLDNVEYDSWQNNLSILYYPSLNPVIISPGDDSSEHLGTTLISLQNRVVYGQAAVAEAECNIAKKSSIITSILKGLQNQCIETSLPAQNPNNSLVDIMSYKDQAPQICEEEEQSKIKIMALEIRKHWQFVLNNQWFIGWTFRNVSDSCVTNLNASLVHQETTNEFKQRSFIENSNDFIFKKPEKRHSIPGEEMTVVMAMDIPTFTSEEFDAYCIIMWNIGVGSNRVYDALSPADIKGSCQQQAFKISLNVHDIFKNKTFEETTPLHQLMSLRTIQDSILIEIISKDSSLSTLEDRAAENQQKHPPKILEFEDTKCMFFSYTTSPFFGINMIWDQINRNKIEAEIHTRTEKELILFIQWLYSILPSDISILPKAFKGKECTLLKKELLIALKDEIDFLHMMASISPNSTSSDGNECIAVNLNSNENNSGNESSSIDIKKTIFLKELKTDVLMKDFLVLNYPET